MMNQTTNKNQKINQYVLLEEIGKGAHGIVYKAYHQQYPDITLAVKVIKITGDLGNIFHEPESLSLLNHPHIINLRDYFLYEGNLVIVTEYINGVNLDQYLAQRVRLTEQEVIIFLVQMADALAQAHSYNIIHRDIKLSNILVTGSGENIKFTLVDFGVSRMAEGIQMIKRVAGTYYYMAPEQLRGRACEHSDLWALGVCAYILLTGVKPFQSRAKDQLFKEVLLSSPQAPSNILGNVNVQFESIIFKLLEKNLTLRIDVNQLKKELQAIVNFTLIEHPLNNYNRKNIDSVTWKKQERLQIKKKLTLFWIFLFLAILPNGVIGPAISMGGVILCYLGQEQNEASQKILGIMILLIGLVTNVIITPHISFLVYVMNYPIDKYSYVETFFNQILTFSIMIWTLLFYVLSLNSFAESRNMENKLAIFNLFKENPENISEYTKKLIALNWQNLNLRQKYIELLLLDKKYKDAIVECKLALKHDPYNFDIVILLANSYFEIGLYEECLQVCNGYFAVSNYSFEFSELQEKCQKNIFEEDIS